MTKSEIKLSETILDVIDANEWYPPVVYEQDKMYCIDLEKHSPLGEDFIATIWFDGSNEDFVRKVCDYYSDFDPQEHAAELISMRGKHEIPNDIQALFNDAKEIDDMLGQLARDLSLAFA